MVITDISPVAAPVRERYRREQLDRLSDAALATRVAATLCRPRVQPADSFLLHAPLELAARVALLPFVDPVHREAARQHLYALVPEWEAHGDAVADPDVSGFGAPGDVARRLRAALDAGDLDAADAAAACLGRVCTPNELAALAAGAVVSRLSAAGHAPIFLYSLPRVSPRGGLSGELLRPLARELARFPDWRIEWIASLPDLSTRGSAPEGDGAALFEAIRATPRLGVPGSDFVYPLMSQVDRAGVASGLLSEAVVTTGPAVGARVLLRSAAWSMLQEPDDHAPYGWSHCLTMPQGVLGLTSALADPATALAVAATYVVGFRAALATRELEPGYAPPHPHLQPDAALRADPATAAAAVWHAPPAALEAVPGLLATAASVQRDAHLVKYVPACLDAAAWDRSQSRLYLAAAASLVAYWHGRR
jgi:hypothetical protein